MQCEKDECHSYKLLPTLNVSNTVLSVSKKSLGQYAFTSTKKLPPSPNSLFLNFGHDEQIPGSLARTKLIDSQRTKERTKGQFVLILLWEFYDVIDSWIFLIRQTIKGKGVTWYWSSQVKRWTYWKSFSCSLFYVIIYLKRNVTNSTPINSLVSVNKNYKSLMWDSFSSLELDIISNG